VTGDVYPPPDAAALAVLIRAWAEDAGLRRAAGAAAAARARDAWTPQHLAEAALNLYNPLIQ
jgi:glycosyltransferase involved in cell wall biosynthesis